MRALLCLLPSLLSADLPQVDPYTRGESTTLQAAGYARLGPLPWADGRTTADIDELIGPGLRWVETAHFKIGSSLAAVRVPGGAPRRRVTAELKRLRTRIPAVGVTRTLDPWLRLHLFAQRAEDLYADLLVRLGASASSFPEEPDQLRRGEAAWGEGPHFGMRDKFTLLLFEKESDLRRYHARFVGGEWQRPKRSLYRSGSLHFAICAEYRDGALRDDAALHGHVVFHLVHNLLTGYRGPACRLPAWWLEGVAQCYARRFDQAFSSFNDTGVDGSDHRAVARWQARLRKRVAAGVFRPAAEWFRMPQHGAWTFDDHLEAWSRADFLMGLEDRGFRAFVNTLEDPTRVLTPRGDQSVAEVAFEAAWGMDAETFDDAWRRFARGRSP